MSDVFAAGRKEKRWIVWLKNFDSTLYTRTGISPNYTYQAVEGDPWILHLETTSFDVSKKEIIEFARTLGLDKVKITRTVDLETVIYPIN